MRLELSPTAPSGAIRGISSKSAAHRILICAALADAQTVIRCDTVSRDIEATADCLRSLGADVRYDAPYFTVTPTAAPSGVARLNCHESGSTLRFLLPIICALGINAELCMAGRLPERPLSPLYEELTAHSARLSPQGSNPLICQGKLEGDTFKIKGNISSQYISGLLFALTLMGGGELIIEGALESAPYVDMTADALSLFGVSVKRTERGYAVPKGARLVSPLRTEVEGDWSNAAFPLCMAAVSGSSVTVTGLDPLSRQGDRQLLKVLEQMGAEVLQDGSSVTVTGRELHGIELDASQIPDTVPVIATVASVAQGMTRIYGASRLRLKESDRLLALREALCSLGADVRETDDGLIINGVSKLSGGEVQCFNDHRIAMSMAVAACASSGTITLNGAECVSKSYPAFWKDMQEKLSLEYKELQH